MEISVPWRQIRLAVGTVYIVALVVFCVHNGVPTSRLSLAALVMTGLAITMLGRGWRQVVRMIADWLPFTAALVLYDRSRGIADGIGLRLHMADVVDVEKAMFAGHVPTVWLQQHLYTPGQAHWYDALMSLIYLSHFLVTPILAAFLWLRNRELWLYYVSRVVVLSFLGLITYVVFPEAPPWMASQHGLIGPVQRISAIGWQWMGAGFAQDALQSAQQDGSNPVAAMPSLHLAFATLAAIMATRLVRNRWNRLFLLYPVAMGFCLVYTGEHYVLDLLVGLAYALGTHYAVDYVRTRWRERNRAEARVAPD